MAKDIDWTEGRIFSMKVVMPVDMINRLQRLAEVNNTIVEGIILTYIEDSLPNKEDMP